MLHRDQIMGTKRIMLMLSHLCHKSGVKVSSGANVCQGKGCSRKSVTCKICSSEIESCTTVQYAIGRVTGNHSRIQNTTASMESADESL
uniref:Uncharacterized protein n=1 Tax=Anguilla anguilla TaxID=7936 RepID=A0A0E9PLP0_ANGAN